MNYCLAWHAFFKIEGNGTILSKLVGEKFPAGGSGAGFRTLSHVCCCKFKTVV